MQIERMSADAVRERLRQTERCMLTEHPSFVAAPKAIEARTVEGVIRVAFECYDSANDASYIVEAPYGTEPPRTQAENQQRLADASIAALETAERVASAVFN